MRSLILAMMLSAGPALASDLACTFTQECLEGESCAETSYGFAVEGMNDKGRAVTGVTDSETMRGNLVKTDGQQHIVFVGKGALHMLSISEGNESRYTVHMGGPMAITYLGSCEMGDG